MPTQSNISQGLLRMPHIHRPFSLTDGAHIAPRIHQGITHTLRQQDVHSTVNGITLGDASKI
jgi:hypothetical protein